MSYQLYVDGKKIRSFRRKHEAIFAAKYAIARTGAKEAVIFAIRADGDLAGHFEVTHEDI